MAPKSSTKAAKRRGPGRPFPKGTSGNPKGRPRGLPNRATVQAKEAALSLAGDPAYLKRLRARLLAGELAGSVEVLLWHYAYGKPPEHIELDAAVSSPDLFDGRPPEKQVALLRRVLGEMERALEQDDKPERSA